MHKTGFKRLGWSGDGGRRRVVSSGHRIPRPRSIGGLDGWMSYIVRVHHGKKEKSDEDVSTKVQSCIGVMTGLNPRYSHVAVEQ